MLKIFSNSKKHDTVIFLDIDNTISPNQLAAGEKDYYASDYNGSHFVSKELFDFFDNLPADIIWLTSWQSDAEATFHRGWQHLKWDDAYSYFEWKYYAAEEFLSKRKNKHYTKIVWIDDDYNEWKYLTSALSQKILPIIPEKNIGITYDDVNKISNFVSNN